MKKNKPKPFCLQSICRLTPLALMLIAYQAEAANYSFTTLNNYADFPGGDYIGANDLNNHKQAVGYISSPADEGRAAIWKPTGSNPIIPTNPGGLGGTFSFAQTINNLGHVVGMSRTSGDSVTDRRAVYWDGNHPAVNLGGPPGVEFSTATGINDHDQIVGYSAGADEVIQATYWGAPGATPTALGTVGGSASEAHAINASGQIVGSSDTRGDVAITGAFWDSPTSKPVALSALGGTESNALAINDAGQIVGYSMLPGDAEWRAVFWNNAQGAALNLGALDFGLGTGNTFSEAHGINNAGLVVGDSWFSNDVTGISVQSGFLWDGKQMIDINSLLPAEIKQVGWVVGNAVDINDQGDILGIATIPNANVSGGIEPHAFILSPTPALVPLPGAAWLFGSAFAGLRVFGRRRQHHPKFSCANV